MPSQSTDPLDVLTVGESMIVLVADRGVPLESAATVSLHGAGAESNVAYYLAQLGHQVGWASRLGDDPFGRRLLAEFSGVGIDVADVVLASGEQTGIYFKDPGGSPEVFYYRSQSAAASMRWPDLAHAVARASRVHVTGITAALNPACADLVAEVMRTARAQGSPVSFDVNYRPALWPVHQAAEVLAELAQLADIVFVGRDEAEGLWGTVTADAVRNRLPTVPTLVVKDGAIGATAFSRSGRTFVAAPSVQVVEPTGAGDAFAAGYLSSLLRGHGTALCLRFGHLLAARVIMTRTDYAELPELAELDALAQVGEQTWNRYRFAPTHRAPVSTAT